MYVYHIIIILIHLVLAITGYNEWYKLIPGTDHFVNTGKGVVFTASAMLVFFFWLIYIIDNWNTKLL